MTDGLGGAVTYSYDDAARLDGMSSSGYNGAAVWSATYTIALGVRSSRPAMAIHVC